MKTHKITQFHPLLDFIVSAAFRPHEAYQPYLNNIQAFYRQIDLSFSRSKGRTTWICHLACCATLSRRPLLWNRLKEPA